MGSYEEIFDGNYHVLYAQAKIVLKDEQKAETLKKDFEKNFSNERCDANERNIGKSTPILG